MSPYSRSLLAFACSTALLVPADAFVFTDERRLDTAVKRVPPDDCRRAGGNYFDPVSLSCLPCPLNSTASSCPACPAGHVRTRVGPGGLVGTRDGCVPCPGRVVVVGGVCLRDDDPVTFPPLSTSSSSFRASVVGCRFNGDDAACQRVANLCVLQLVSSAVGTRSRSASLPGPCDIYEQLAKLGPGTVVAGLPQIVYPSGRAAGRYLTSDAVDERFTNVGRGSRLTIVAATFDDGGRFVGMETLGSVLRSTCPGLPRNLFRYGITYEVVCRFERTQFNSTRPATFVDLYLAFRNRDDVEMLFPLPSRLAGSGGSSEDGDLQLLRRLPMSVLSADPATTTTTTTTTNSRPRRFYPKRLDLSVTRRKRNGGSDAPGYIYPPLLTVDYAEVSDGTGGDAGGSLTMRVSVEFVTDVSDVYRDVGIAVGVLGVVAAMLGLVRTWIWARRRGSSPSSSSPGAGAAATVVDASVAAHLFVFCAASVADAAFLVVSVVAVAWFAVFRLQAEPLVFLPRPDGDDETFFVAFFVSAFVFKALEVVLLVHDQTTVGLFFLDWERPLAVRDESVVVKGDENEGKVGTVSIWRSYALAERWLALQTHRRVSFVASIFATVLVLESFGLKSATSTAPDLDELASAMPGVRVPDSYVSRVALMILVFTLMWTVQWVGYKFVYERYVNNLLNQFVDLCSLANVSLFVFVGHNFGYYVHGRSPAGRSDVDLRSMHLQLERERRDHCSSRGLLPNSDAQVFSFSLPAKFSAFLAKVRAAARAGAGGNGNPRHRASTAGLGGSRQRTSSASPENAGIGGSGFLPDEVESASREYAAMTRFLSAFVEHNLKDMDYRVTERLFVESLLNAEFQEPGADRAVFFKEQGNSGAAGFADVLFYGCEFTLGSFELAAFVFFDTVCGGDFVAAGFCAYAVCHAVAYARRKLACVNIGRRGLLDPRFLS